MIKKSWLRRKKNAGGRGNGTKGITRKLVKNRVKKIFWMFAGLKSFKRNRK